jgi:hypothetical protein
MSTRTSISSSMIAALLLLTLVLGTSSIAAQSSDVRPVWTEGQYWPDQETDVEESRGDGRRRDAIAMQSKGRSPAVELESDLANSGAGGSAARRRHNDRLSPRD